MNLGRLNLHFEFVESWTSSGWMASRRTAWIHLVASGAMLLNPVGFGATPKGTP